MQRGQRVVAARRGAVEDAAASDLARQLRAEHAIVGVGRLGPLARGATFPGAMLASPPALHVGRRLLGLHPDRPRADQPGGLALVDLGRQVDRLEVEHLLQRLDQLGHVHAVLGARLHQQVGAPDQVLGALVAEHRGDLAQLLAHRGEEARAVGRGGLVLLRRELLQPLEVRLLLVLDLRGDAHVTGVELAATADGAAQRNHRERAEADPVGAQAVQLHDVPGVAIAAVRPDLHPVADARLHQRQVHRASADVRRQPHMAQRVRARGARAALEARQRDHVRARLGDAHADGADVRHHGHLHRHPHLGVRGLQLVDQLGQVLDRVEVVVVGGRDQVGALGGVSRLGDLRRYLLPRQVPALARLGALADLDLHEVRRVEHLAGDAETARGHLLATPERVLAVHVLDLAALAVHGDDVGPLGRLRVGAVGRLALRAEAHRGDHYRVIVQAHAGVGLLGGDRLPV